ncbi:unnamed protein product [Caretta caretta]
MIHVSGRVVNCSAVAGSWEPDVLLRQPEKLTLTLIISKVSLNYCLRDKPALMYISQTAQSLCGAEELRLVDGGSPCAGRVEVKHQDQWGTVCEDDWDMEDAGVVCKQLGCGAAVSAHDQAHFGAGSGPIWLDDVACDGTESALSHCRNAGWGVHDCDHDWDAGVTCSGHIELQLVGGDSACSGRVEVRHGDTWATICDAHFDLKAASVICNGLECGTALSIPGGAHFREGHGPIWTEEFQCVGNESHLVYCPRISHGSQTCSHANDASVICSRLTGFRLVNGSTACSGRVEIQVLGAWGTLCDSRWDLPDANVLCRQLDCGFAVSNPGGGYFGKGTGSVWTDTFHCKGTETHLGHCPVTALGASQCSHDNDASVICSEFTDLRLVSDSDCAGRLEVFYNGTWGSVCSNAMSVVTPAIVCKQLNCGDKGQIASDFEYGAGSGPRWLDHVACSEQHSSLWQCLSDPWDPKSCDNRAEETHISCTDQDKLRVMGGEDRCSGRVEVWYRGFWGTVCDDSWDMADANVVCKQLGCGSAVSAPGEAAFGQGTGPIWVETLNCRGTESSLWDCPAKPWGESNCGHKEDAAVNCSGSRRPLDPFSEAVYEEIDYNLMRKKQEMFSRSVSYSDDSVTKLQYYTGDSEGENDPGSEQEGSFPRGSQLDYDNVEEPVLNDVPQTPDGRDAPALPGDVPGDGYDDAREVSDPEGDTGLGQNEEEGTEASERNGDSQGGEFALHTVSAEWEGWKCEHSVVRNALFCLETATEQGGNHVYTRALLAYAFALAGKEENRRVLLDSLDKEAVKEDGSIHWQRPGKEPEADLPFYHPRAPSAEVEMTSYVLLAYLTTRPAPSQGDVSLAAQIVKWISKQQNPNGGFSSTQDTVVALQALSLYGASTYAKSGGASTVTLQSTGNFQAQFQVDHTNRLLLQRMALPEVPGDYSTGVTGEGCVYVQTSLRYNVLPKPGEAPFALEVHTVPETCDSTRAQRTFDIAISIRYTGKRPVSNMVIVDVKMLSGFIPVKTSVRKSPAAVIGAVPRVNGLTGPVADSVLQTHKVLNQSPLFEIPGTCHHGD